MTRQQRWQIKQRANNRCIYCGKRRVPASRTYCEFHRQLTNQRRRKLKTQKPPLSVDSGGSRV